MMLAQRSMHQAVFTPAAVKLLLYLLEHREANLTRIVKETGLAWATVYHSLKILKQYGLIYEYRYGKAWLVSLSERGYKIALKLKEIEELLKA